MPNKSDEQKVAEAEVEGFRKALGPFVVAAESTRMAMAFTDAKESDNPIIFANASFLSLTGYNRQEVLGRSFNSLMARGSTRTRTGSRKDCHRLVKALRPADASLHGVDRVNLR